MEATCPLQDQRPPQDKKLPDTSVIYAKYSAMPFSKDKRTTDKKKRHPEIIGMPYNT